MYYTMIKQDGHLRTQGKCRKTRAAEFSNDWSVLSQCNTRLRLLQARLKYRFYTRKTIKHTFSMFYTLMKHGFLTNQNARRVLSIF